ncbi:hypothetical protein DFP72DRAFT_904910 [Ephemerocybe angulata]|uniref:Uncharacterized protein n=1 Tax=Ephemerocybe angulata TaxID=980116 RepID=A0A8H6HSN8_9AGAR|nr:hypothetical protein DFP72DRAFT_904910 [Tulosesus angulatus]
MSPTEGADSDAPILQFPSSLYPSGVLLLTLYMRHSKQLWANRRTLTLVLVFSIWSPFCPTSLPFSPSTLHRTMGLSCPRAAFAQQCICHAVRRTNLRSVTGAQS